jgi:small basic protein
MPPQVFSLRPPTPEELDTLATISAVSFILGALAFLCVLGAASAVAIKTRLPGRYNVLLSLILLASWWAFERAMGGNLEMTFGPEALLVTFVVYGAIAVLFAIGYVRMCLAFLQQQARSVPHS